MKKYLYLLCLLILIFVLPKITHAINISCNNRYVTLINPVRGRDLWIDKSLEPIKTQYNLIKQNDFSATWLLQYDALVDKNLISEVNKFDTNQENGILLEISPALADKARVIYPHSVVWYNPKVVFLSGYTQSERRRLIDKLFEKFKEVFDYYPKSVGAWWIDSYSLSYLKDKYGIEAAMIVADQKTTDNYGVWGQWWGMPYYPSKSNILIPASNLKNKQNIVILQWAQRDPLQAFGEGPKFSNYSLQANDYIRQGKDTGYFNKLVDVYLDCQNPLGQITVGLETGIESIQYLSEYSNQLKALKERKNLKAVTMSNFAKEFSYTYPAFPNNLKITYQDSNWDLTTSERSNKLLGDFVSYNQTVSFADYFVKDKSDFLDRRLRNSYNQVNTIWFPWYLIMSLILFVFSIRKRLLKIWFISTLFALVCFGLILRSFYQYGLKVLYGPNLPYLEFFQTFLVLISFLLVWIIDKETRNRKVKVNLWILCLIFGIDPIIKAFRMSLFSGKYYIGFAIDSLKFIGISFSEPFNIEFINRDFPSYISTALLRFDFNKIWDNLYLTLLVYPLLHIILALPLGYLLMKLPKNIRHVILVICIILFSLHLKSIFNADPRLVQ